MFLSFLSPIPEEPEQGLLVIYYDGKFQETKVMKFPDEKPEFETDQSILVGFSEPVGQDSWTFQEVGSSVVENEDTPDAPSISFFSYIILSMKDEDKPEFAQAKKYLDGFITAICQYFFPEPDDEQMVWASWLEEEQADGVIMARIQGIN